MSPTTKGALVISGSTAATATLAYVSRDSSLMAVGIAIIGIAFLIGWYATSYAAKNIGKK